MDFEAEAFQQRSDLGRGARLRKAQFGMLVDVVALGPHRVVKRVFDGVHGRGFLIRNDQSGAGQVRGRRFAAGQVDPAAFPVRWRAVQCRRVAIGHGQQQRPLGAV